MSKEIFAVYYRDKWDGQNNENAVAYIPMEVTVHGIKQPTYTLDNNKYKINDNGIKYLNALNVWTPKSNNQDIEIYLQKVDAEQRISILKSNIRTLESLITQIYNAKV